VVERGTSSRLAGVKALFPAALSDLDALVEAQHTFLRMIVVQQLEDIAHGTPASNSVEVGRLAPGDRAQLRGALQAVSHLDDLTRDLLFAR
jgi:DNA polymerase-3 subunit epsilon/CBS domain-containing protein